MNTFLFLVCIKFEILCLCHQKGRKYTPVHRCAVQHCLEVLMNGLWIICCCWKQIWGDGACTKVVWNIVFKNCRNNFVLGGANVRGISGSSMPSQ